MFQKNERDMLGGTRGLFCAKMVLDIVSLPYLRRNKLELSLAVSMVCVFVCVFVRVTSLFGKKKEKKRTAKPKWPRKIKYNTQARHHSMRFASKSY